MSTIARVGLNLGSLYKRVPDERPQTVGAQHAQGLTLLTEPKPMVRARGGVPPDLDAILHTIDEPHLMEFCRLELGEREMEKNGGLWRRIAQQRPGMLFDALHHLRMLKREGRGPANCGAWVMSAAKPQASGPSLA
jgi:hypothetical protein